MSTSVDTSFIQLYEAEVKAAYQRGTLLRNTCRTRNQVGAERIYFPTLGKGEATTKARHADVVPMDLTHGRAFADMADYYAPEYIDELDQAKINWSLRQDYSKASGMSLARKTDDIILNAVEATTNIFGTNGLDSGASGVITLKVLAGLEQEMNDNDVPLDGRRWAITTPAGLNQIQQITQVNNIDYVNNKILPTGQAPTQFLGFNWIVHSGMAAIDPAQPALIYAWHEDAVGHGICKDITTRVDWVAQKAAWLVNSMMSMGATIIDGDGVFKVISGANP